MSNRRNNHVSNHTASVSIRWTDSDTEGRLAAVAARDSQRLPDGPWLVDEIEGEALAVLSLETGSFVADPFSRTVELRALLELRAEQARGRVNRWRIRPRASRGTPSGIFGKPATLSPRPRF
jgi:hypothetical protein